MKLRQRLLQYGVLSAMLLIALWPIRPAHAHALPVSYLDMKADACGVSATLEASVKDWVRESSSLDGQALLSSRANEQGKQLLSLLTSRLQLRGDSRSMQPQLRGVEPLSDLGDVRLRLYYDWPSHQPKQLEVRCRLFPRDPNHKTFLALYRGDTLERQDILDATTPRVDVLLDAPSHDASGTDATGTFVVVKRFVREGIHHIFIGPDHILFIVGLLLLGGSIGKLLKIVTSFTIAHSFTLALATLGILNPPARVVEPLIALSIVFVGMHDLRQLRAHPNEEQKPVGRGQTDVRMLFAFGFGLVHGFGFASVLRELDLPRAALFWSLGAFNLGVEIGQMCIVLSVAPLLALLGRRSRPLAWRIAMTGSVVVVAAGAFWFIQRVAFA